MKRYLVSNWSICIYIHSHLEKVKTHYDPRVVSNLPRITTNIWELSHQLQPSLTMVGRANNKVHLVEVRTYGMGCDRFSKPGCEEDGDLGDW